MEVSAINKNSIDQQRISYDLLFNSGQHVIFQKAVNSSPIFVKMPAQEYLDYPFICLNPCIKDSPARRKEFIACVQSFCIEQDFISKELQRKWFYEFFPQGGTVEVDSGRKSIHHLIRLTNFDEQKSSYLCTLLKKCFPFSDWGVFQDSAKLVRNPGGKRDNTTYQNILHCSSRYQFEDVCALLEPYAKKIGNSQITHARTTLKEYLFENKFPVSWKGKTASEMIICGLTQLIIAGYDVKKGLIYEAYLENFMKQNIPEMRLKEYIAKAIRYKHPQKSKAILNNNFPSSNTNALWISKKLASIDLIEVLEKFYGPITVVKENAEKKIILCPYHDDHHPSAWIKREPDGVELLHCSANCPAHDRAKNALHVLRDRGYSFLEACRYLFGKLPP